MNIPIFSDGDLLKDIREKSIIPTINLVNELDTEVEALQTTVTALTEDVVSLGTKCKVDNRAYAFTSSTSELSIPIDLEDDEYAVRAVVRVGARNGEFTPVNKMAYDRTSKVLTVTVGNNRSGLLFCEFWKIL